jgi:hypothetical protein
VSTPVRPTTHARPTPPATRRKKGRGIGIFLFIAVIWIGFGIYSATRNSHHGSSTADRSDLVVAPSSVTVPAGGRGVVALRLTNNGPDDLDHTVVYTFTTSAGLTITGPGSIDEGDGIPYVPKGDCTLNTGGAGMSCDMFLDLAKGRHDIWRIPVRVASDVAPGTARQLSTTAVSKYSSLLVDPNKANNTRISYAVHVSKRGSKPPVTPTHPSSPVKPHPTSPSAHPTSPSRAAPTHPSSGRPSVPGGTVPAPAQPRTSHTSAGKQIRNGARDAVRPVTIAAAAVVGLALLIYVSLIVVARRQRRLPLDYVPPRQDKRH